jgi:SAM-dependent methyltransferase
MPVSNHTSALGFQASHHVETVEDCTFYHTMELPGAGLIPGAWDLRDDVDAYLGHQRMAGKRIVDVGTASGYLCFEMERRGGDVVAFDRLLTTDPDDDMGLVPFADFERRHPGGLAGAIQERRETQRRLQESFWFAHERLRSRAQLFCGTAYECPKELGEFDYAFFGSILLHLRDPLRALTSFARATREKIIITEPSEEIGPLNGHPVMVLRPQVSDLHNIGTWWYLQPTVLQRFLEVLGFTRFTITHHGAMWVATGTRLPLFTLVAERAS